MALACLAATGAWAVAAPPASATGLGKITGEVRAKNGTELEGAEVCAEVETTEVVGGWTYAGCTYSGAHGDYTLEGLPSSNYRIEFSGEVCTPGPVCHQEYTQQWWEHTPVLIDATPVEVTAPATTAGIDAELESSGEITGKVTTVADTPVVDTTACAHPVDGTHSGACATTNTNGEYTIAGLETGSYKVEFNGTTCQEGGCDTYVAQYYHDKATEGEAETVEVTAPHATPDIDAVLIEARKITGHVYAGDGPGIVDTQVCAQRQAEGTELTEENEHCTYTSTGGEYAIEGLPVGEYLVTFVGEVCPGQTCHPEYAPQFFEGATNRGEATEVELTEATERGVVDAHLLAGASISGTVTTDWLTPEPIEDAQVCAYKTPSNGLGDQCAYANAAGEYTIAGLQSGDYHVEFSGNVCPSVGPCHFGVYVKQFYNGEGEGSDEEHAAGVSVSTGQTTHGIDGELAEPAPTLPANKAAPTLTGAGTVGATLHCSQGEWSNNPAKLKYAWLRNATVIAGATASVYTVQSADQGDAIACQVTVSNGAGSAAATSNSIAIPAAVVMTTTTTGTVAGIAVVTGPATVKHGRATVKLRCTGSGPCRGTVELQATSTTAKTSTSHRKRTVKVLIAKASFAIAAGASQTVSLTLTSAGDKLLARASKKGLRVSVSGSDVKAGSLVLYETHARGRHRS